jgi:hypothetical protein
MNRATARECLTNGGRKTSEEEIDEFLKRFKEGTPVMPVSFFCDALKTWNRLSSLPSPQVDYLATDEQTKQRRVFGERVSDVFIQIMKSNLLHRMIYMGEKPREKYCPVHKGRWSGCKLEEDTECKGACMSGSNVTGWLRE